MTIVEFLDRMVPLEDDEVSAELAKRYRRLGIEVLTSTRVESIDDTGDEVTGHRHRKDGEQQVLEADKVLQAIGFAAPGRGLRPGEHRRRADRARRDRRSTAAAAPTCRTSSRSAT